MPGYQAESIHATHTGMTKFTGKTDPGYDKVSGQLSIWCSELRAAAPAPEAQAQASSNEQVRDRRVERFAQFQPERRTQQWSGTVNSNGGMVMQGNPSVGGGYAVWLNGPLRNCGVPGDAAQWTLLAGVESRLEGVMPSKER